MESPKYLRKVLNILVMLDTIVDQRSNFRKKRNLKDRVTASELAEEIEIVFSYQITNLKSFEYCIGKILTLFQL
ncbi:hypothetical protein RCL_jg27936.t1 [Rhizophagus clarus]|uniref:Uncharacterized protein n=1 Tax=Rhizophagus clarus TaxID=94130 RepID=A0A8H3QXK7_9GLOM|nr:hypothetical protein RCL_jg27936.t1 [Rhizophagus clarus]